MEVDFDPDIGIGQVVSSIISQARHHHVMISSQSESFSNAVYGLVTVHHFILKSSLSSQV